MRRQEGPLVKPANLANLANLAKMANWSKSPYIFIIIYMYIYYRRIFYVLLQKKKILISLFMAYSL